MRKLAMLLLPLAASAQQVTPVVPPPADSAELWVATVVVLLGSFVCSVLYYTRETQPEPGAPVTWEPLEKPDELDQCQELNGARLVHRR